MARGKFGKAALLMGAAAVAAGVLLKRDKVQALLNPGSRQTEPGWTPAQPPEPSNYDAPGPPANTATPVPAPDAQILEEDGSVDEAAEEAAAAAEAANIGGQVSDYAGIQDPDEPASEAERPLVEAGEGFSEGEEQAEAELAVAAQPSDGVSDFERQIDEVIDEQSSPTSGETLEPIGGIDDAPGDAELRAAETQAAADFAADQVAAEGGRSPASSMDVPAPPPAPEPPAPDPADAPTQAYSVPPLGGAAAPDAPGDAPAAPQPSDTAAEAEAPSAYETYVTPAVSPPAADPIADEPAGEVPFGTGTTTETPGLTPMEDAAPTEPPPPPTQDAPETPGTPSTSSWQPPAPPEPAPEAEPAQPPATPAEDPAAGTPAADPESSDPTPPTQAQPQLPTDDKDDDDGNDWRTWSGRAIDP